MKRILLTICIITMLCSCTNTRKDVATSSRFVSIKGCDLVDPNGKKIFIQGINLGNWLNPEGYMFLFDNSPAASFRNINEGFCEMVGPDFTKEFWRRFKENYITEKDIQYIAKTGMNSIRIPFHYKLFTDEDYMGLDADQNGFEILDKLIGWCHKSGIYVILDMHDAPGGQTGDNIDDSYAYPWLMESEPSKQLYCSIWQNIARHYANEPTVLGYDLMNEPIAHFLLDKHPQLNDSLLVLYKRCIDSIRKVDQNHILLIGGAQWNSNFKIFEGKHLDDNMMFTCHKYGCDTLQQSIQYFVDFRDKVKLPMYMGETGENTNTWIAGFTRLMNRNNIGWNYWLYKKMVPGSCMVTIPTPKDWDVIIWYMQADRRKLSDIRDHQPDPQIVRNAMEELLENMKFEHCIKNTEYTKALGMKP